MYAVALIIGVIAALRAGDCEDCAYRSYRDKEEEKHK